MKTVIVLKDVIARIGDQSVKLAKGAVVTVPEYDADNLVRGHYAEYTKEKAGAVDVLDKIEKQKAARKSANKIERGGAEDMTL